MSARSWTLTIPAPAPWLNANDRGHWSKRSGLTRVWRETAQILARQQRLPGLGKVCIEAVLSFPDKRRRDAHNYYPTLKAIVDGLVDHGLIPDDSAQYLIGPDIRVGEPVRAKKYGPSGVVVLTIREAS